MKATLDELNTFVAVIDCGTISHAADKLDLTVSAVSRSLSRLEEKLGTTLISRTTRKMELTIEGQAYLEKVRKILDDINEAEEMLALKKGMPSGRLRVDAATPFMLNVIAPLIKEFVHKYPHIQLELNNNDQVIDLLEKRTDVAIRIGELQDSTLHAALIAKSQIRILASPNYLSRHGVPTSIQDLKNHSLIGFSNLEKLNYWPILDSEKKLFHVNTNIKASSGETVKKLALDGVGIACLSDFMTAAERQNSELVQLFADVTIESMQSINAVYYKNSVVSSRVSSFINFLKERLNTQLFL